MLPFRVPVLRTGLRGELTGADRFDGGGEDQPGNRWAVPIGRLFRSARLRTAACSMSASETIGMAIGILSGVVLASALSAGDVSDEGGVVVLSFVELRFANVRLQLSSRVAGGMERGRCV